MKEFPCTKCGACCKLVPDNLLSIFSLPKSPTGGCGHLKEDNSCAIYDNRPDICSVATMYKRYHSKNMTWDEYINLSLKSCEELQNKLENKK